MAYTHCLCLRFGAEKLTWRSPTVVEENWDEVALALGFFLIFFWAKKINNTMSNHWYLFAMFTWYDLMDF